MRFFVGLHHPADARHFDSAFISVNALRKRKSDFPANDWILDSGAFTTIHKLGSYPEPPASYAAQVRRWATSGNLLAAVSEDMMCEPLILARTGLTVPKHQRITIERYDALLGENLPVYLMPVLQGYEPREYLAHLSQYGERLGVGAWVGVGSVCKRNGDPTAIEAIFRAILAERPDLRLHGFGLKITALRSAIVQDALHSADSMAWSYAARRDGRNGNDWREAKRFVSRIETMPIQEQFRYAAG